MLVWPTRSALAGDYVLSGSLETSSVFGYSEREAIRGLGHAGFLVISPSRFSFSDVAITQSVGEALRADQQALNRGTSLISPKVRLCSFGRLAALADDCVVPRSLSEKRLGG